MTMTMTMTKAEKIFKDTYYECMSHIKTWGYSVNPNGEAVGFSRLVTEETTCTRTFNEVQKFIDRRRRDEEVNARFGIGDPERRELVAQTLNMVQSTLNNSIKSEKEFKEWLRA